MYMLNNKGPKTDSCGNQQGHVSIRGEFKRFVVEPIPIYI